LERPRLPCPLPKAAHHQVMRPAHETALPSTGQMTRALASGRHTDDPTMTLEEFRHSFADYLPADALPVALQALWWLGKGDWKHAHACVQQHEGEPDCDLVHAHLHRLQGDLANAGYWYRQAGRPVATVPPEQEWATVAAQLLART